MSLSVLSNEIISEIINCLDGSLTSISLCSRQLHSITEPILYSNIHLNYPKSYTNFIRTVIAKPYLVKHVRHFRTKGKFSHFINEAQQLLRDKNRGVPQTRRISRLKLELIFDSFCFCSRPSIWLGLRSLLPDN